MSAEAVALCMGISDSKQALLISSGDLRARRARGGEERSRLEGVAGPEREAALAAAPRREEVADPDRRKDLAAAAAIAAARHGEGEGLKTQIGRASCRERVS